MKQSIAEIARRALPLMTPAHRAEAERLIAELSTANADAPETLAEFTAKAAKAFEADMKPVVNAVVAAMKADDPTALKGLRMLLPHLLAQVTANPAMTDLLAHQLGAAFIAALTTKPSEEAE